jgi:hypothetical protein
VRLLVALVALSGIVATLAVDGHAARPCAKQVFADWADDGRFERKYRLVCYEDAIDTLPSDIRDYTDARERIERALMSAARGDTPPAPEKPRATPRQAVGTIQDQGSAAFPLPLLVLAGLGLALLAAAALGRVARRSGLGRRGPRR